MMWGLRDWSLGERPAEREVGGPLVPGSWERGKVPREPWPENLGEEREGSCNGSERTGRLGESSIQRLSSKLEAGSAM